MADKFSWDEIEDDLVLKEQLAIAVYENPKGDTVVRQAADRTRDEDNVIIINRNNLAVFVGALQRHLEDQQQHDDAAPRNAR